MKDLKLPEDLRPILAEFHRIVDCNTYTYTPLANMILMKSTLYTLLHKLIVVGDYVCRNIVEAVGIPRICVIDLKTMRTSLDSEILNELRSRFDYVMSCKNKPGTISTNCIEVLEEILYRFRGCRTLLIVEGEEDLLTLALLLKILPDEDYLILYGIPKRGIAVVYTTIKSIVEALNIASRMYY